MKLGFNLVNYIYNNSIHYKILKYLMQKFHEKFECPKSQELILKINYWFIFYSVKLSAILALHYLT